MRAYDVHTIRIKLQWDWTNAEESVKRAIVNETRRGKENLLILWIFVFVCTTLWDFNTHTPHACILIGNFFKDRRMYIRRMWWMTYGEKMKMPVCVFNYELDEAF